MHEPHRRPSRPRLRVLTSACVAALLAVLTAACGSSGGSGGGGEGEELSLVAYSTPKEAYERITAAFAKTPEGRGTTFSESYGASGEQSRAVESGLPADLVALSLEPDVTKLVEAGLVDPNWKNDRYRGFVTESVVTLAVRPGNPKNIRTWEDLVKPGVEIVTPNPQTSGGAKWNIMAAYGAQSDGGRAPERGFDYLRRFFGNVAVSDKSAREALQTFAGGKGDVLVAYENEAITAQNKGEKLDYVTPDDTIRIENPVAVTKDAQPKARAFADYLRTEPAQRVFIGEGYRPVVRDLRDEKRFPEPKGLFSIDDLGGWSRVNKEFFDEENGRVTRIQQEQLDGGG